MPTSMSPGTTSAPIPYDAAVVKVPERLLADVGDVPRYLFLAELYVPRDDLELLDMHGGEDVFLKKPFAYEYGVLEVIPAPRHEGHEDVPAEREFSVARSKARPR